MAVNGVLLCYGKSSRKKKIGFYASAVRNVRMSQQLCKACAKTKNHFS